MILGTFRLPTRAVTKSVLSLAAPIAVIQAGMMLYGLVDTLFLGRVSAAALAGAGVASATFHMVFLFGLGFLLGIDTLASRAFGAGKTGLCAEIIIHAMVLAALISAPIIAALGAVEPLYWLVGIDKTVADVALEYLAIFRWLALPALLFVCCRHYLQSMNITRPLLFAIAVGNTVNVFINYCLVFGHLGFPAMGVRGCAIASVISACVMLLVGLAAVLRQALRADYMFRSWSLGTFLELIQLGLPAGLHLMAEVSFFAMVTMLMARFGPVPTAGHQITMNFAALTFMIPLGISLAAAVQVGQGLGRQDPHAAVQAGDTALMLGVTFMAGAGVIYMLIPEQLIRLFTADPEVIAVGAPLLRIAAVFQIFDGTQVIMTGSLRGLGETRLPLYATVCSHLLLGLPLGYWLAFHAEMGPPGLWIGLLTGLGVVAVTLFFMWRSRVAALLEHPPAIGVSRG
ncbi:MAG: MATE family efflux transporter [Elusimicrobiota bacterium]